jgi:hypothetical protein
MKLNGQFYVKMSVVMGCVHDISMNLSDGGYHEISEAIRNIKPENASSVVSLLDDFVDDSLYPMCVGENKTKDEYVKLSKVIDVIEDSVYDPKKHDVALFKTGAYGIKVSAESESINKYIYNVCMHILTLKIRKLTK